MSIDDDSEFARMLGGVKRLEHDRINPYSERGPRAPLRAPRPQAEFVDPPYLSEAAAPGDTHFNRGLQVKLQRKIRQGTIRPEASLDLHGYRRDEAFALLQEYLADALNRRHRMILIIHGQGYRSSSEAVLKPLVQRFLADRPEVLAWCPAQARDGAGGATYVYLRA